MLKKGSRADKKIIEKIFKKGRFINSPNLTFKFILSQNSTPSRISFIVPKSVDKLAVKRNSLRRCGYDALRRTKIPSSLIGVFIFKKSVLSVSELENEIKNIFSKIN